MIEELRLQNFKSWKGPIQARFAPLTGFFGTNSSGKTSLWQILLLLKQTVQSHNQSRILNTGGSTSDLIDVGSVPEIIYQNGSSFDFGITWKTKFSLFPVNKFSYDASIGYEKEEVYLRNMIYGFHSTNRTDQIKAIYSTAYDQPCYELYYETELLGHFNDPIKCYAIPTWYHPKKASAHPELSEEQDFDKIDFENPRASWSIATEDFESLFPDLYYLGPLREYPQRYYQWTGDNYSDIGIKGEFAVHALLANGKKDVRNLPPIFVDAEGNEVVIDDKDGEVITVNEANIPHYTAALETSLETRVAQWLVEMGLVHSFRIQPIGNGRLYEVRVKRHAHSPEVLMTEMGFGLSQILPVLVLCYSCPVGSILILEQPEIHLHPAVQAALADVFIDVIKTRGVQIILESHSEHLLRRLQRRIAEKQLEVNDTALYFCEMGEDGASQLRSLELNTFGEIANWPKDFFGNMMDDILQIMEARLGE